MNKTIVVTGATGFVGTKLCLELFIQGYKLKILCRSVDKAQKLIPLPAEFIKWSGHDPLDPSIFEGSAGVIHLAGEPVAGGRWTKRRKERILTSRTQTTQYICSAVQACKLPPPVMVGASAIGIYGDAADEVLTETSPEGSGFLAEVCQAWEKSYKSFNGRLVMLRTGIVLGYGGALSKMLLPFRLGAGGRLASGKQWMSWIHIDDLVKMYVYALENDNVSGPINAVSSQPLRNTDFTKKLSQALKVPAIFPVPSFALKLIFGEMSSILLGSQRVSADKISTLNFKFKYTELSEAFNSLLSPEGYDACHVYSAYQWVPKNKEEIFLFFSQAENLEVITPPWLNFRIVKKSDPQIIEGTIIDYKLKIKGMPASWKTLISHWAPPHYFTDSQIRGPYSKWEHTHHFSEIQGGTLMTDQVIYKAPLGPLGHIVREILIENDIKTIFEYRTKKIKELF